MDDRRYSDEEIALILRKATETASSRLSGREHDGLTLEQLKGIAQEVGIDPTAVESAARALTVHGPSRRRGGLIGAPVTPSCETVVPVDFPPEKLGEAVSIIRRVMGRQGIVEDELGAMEWRARDVVGGRYVSIRPTEGGTRLRAFGNFRDGALALFVAGGFAGSALLAALLKTAGAAAVLGLGTAPVAIGAALLSARFVWKRLGEREARALEQVVAELEALGSRPTLTEARDEPPGRT